MAGLTGLAVRIGADVTGYRKGMDEVMGTARKAAKEIPAAMAVASAAVAAIGAIAIDAGRQYEEGMKKIRAGTGATGEALKQLGEDARAVFRQNDDTFSDVADTVANLNTRLGLTGAPLRQLTGQFLDLADITGEQLVPLTTAATQAMQGWNVPTEKQSSLLDYLYKVSQSTGISVTKLSTDLADNTASFRSLGLSVEQSAALLGKWEKEGVKSEVMLAGLKKGVNTLEAAGYDASSGMQELVRSIKEDDEATSRDAATKVMGTRAANDFFDAVKNGRFDIEGLTADLEANQDTIKKAADESKTSGEKMQEAWNKVIDALMPVGEAILGVTAFLVDGLAPALELLGPLLTTIINGLQEFFKASKAGLEQYLEWLNVGETAATQAKKFAVVDADSAKLIRERIALLKQRGAAEEDINRELENLILTGVKLTEAEREQIRVLREREATEKAAAEALKKTAEVTQKVHVDLSRLGKTEREVKATTEQLRDSWRETEAQLKLDMAATGKFNLTLENHRGTLEGLIKNYQAWGMELPPLLADAKRLYDQQAEADRQYEELLAKIEAVTESLREQGDVALDTSADWQQLTDKLKGVGLGDVDFDFGEIDWTQAAPPKGFFDRLGGTMGDAFQDGFAESFKNNGDIKAAVQVGLGQAISAGLTAALGPAAANPIVASFIQVIGASVGKFLGSSLFGEKLTNEQLAKGYGEAFAKQFGLAFNKEFEAALMQAASRIPAVRDRIDASVAQFMPEMISHILSEIDSLTPQIQASLAQSIGHGVNYLMEKGGLSHKKAFEQFLPQFGEIIRQALAGGQALDQGILNLIEHARNLGVDFSELGGTFAAALEELLSGTEISAEKLRNLADVAAAVGVDIADVFAAALDDFIDSEDFSIEKMEELARAARAAGLDVSESLTEAIRDARAELADLDAAARDIGASILDAFIRKLDLKGAGQELREKFVGERTKGIEDEARAAAAREAAQARFNELKAKARAIDIDGKNDARDIREAIKGLPDDEAKIVLELARQRLERKEAREEIKRQRKEQKLANEQLAAQNRLVTALENLFKSLSDPLEQNKTTAEGFAGALGAAKGNLEEIQKLWQWLLNHPLDLPQGQGTGTTGAGAFGGSADVFTAGFGGAAVPVAQFGSQVFGSAPAAKGGGGVPVIISTTVKIEALDAKSLNDRGVDIANAVASGVKRGLSNLRADIVRGV
jgi:hypothetical protein